MTAEYPDGAVALFTGDATVCPVMLGAPFFIPDRKEGSKLVFYRFPFVKLLLLGDSRQIIYPPTAQAPFGGSSMGSS